MTDISAAFQGRLDELARTPAAAAPATLGEIARAEWNANGLDTVTGVSRPFMDAYDELSRRTEEITGQSLPDMARARGLPFFGTSVDGRIATIGKIVDSLPDAQAGPLADYKDVHGRARQKAAEIMRTADEVRGATYGLSGHATAFLSGVARQMVDPVNLALAPAGATNPAIGAARTAIMKWLGKEFVIGAATQAVQEPYIALRREELGLPSNSFENILQAGIGQAGLSGLFRGAGAALRAMRAAGRDLPPGLDGVSPHDMDAAALREEAQAHVDRAAGMTPDGQEAVVKAGRALNGDGPLEGIAPSHATIGQKIDGEQPIIRADGERLTARYAVVERRDLIASNDLDGRVNPAFPQELQPRDRSREGSRLQIANIAARLEPELLGPAHTAREGAPVVGSDGVVESGNGRVLAIEQAYRAHPDKAEAYRAYLDTLGFDVRQMEQPVLVRIRQGEMDWAARKTFTDESNVSLTATLGGMEQAKKDARALDGYTLHQWQGGSLTRPENVPFLRAFSDQVLTPEERGAFMTVGGGLSREGADRIQAALVAKGYDNDRLTRALTEELDPTSKSIINALADAAPQSARLREAIAEGRVPVDVDVLRPLAEAFELVDRARATGQKPREMFDQIDLERGAVSEATRAAGELFFRNADMTLAAGRETVAARIEWAVSKALMHEGGGLFGDTLDAAQVLRMARLATEDLSQLDMMRAMAKAADAPVVRADAPLPETAKMAKMAATETGAKPQPAKLPDDPNAARATALLDEAGGDVKLPLDEGDVSARKHLEDIEGQRRAAAELADCVDRTGGRLETGE